MAIDHINLVLFDEKYYYMTLIGRFAFPLFAFFLVRNYLYFSTHKKQYFLRLFIFGLISQPVVMWVFHYPVYELNIFFSLASGIALMYALETKDYLLLLLVIFIASFSEYTLLGLLLIWSIYNVFKNENYMGYLILFLALVLITAPNHIIIAPFVFLVLLEAKSGFIVKYILHNSPEAPGIKISGLTKYFFYIFYPVHLIILGLIR